MMFADKAGTCVPDHGRRLAGVSVGEHAPLASTQLLAASLRRHAALHAAAAQPKSRLSPSRPQQRHIRRRPQRGFELFCFTTPNRTG